MQIINGSFRKWVSYPENRSNETGINSLSPVFLLLCMYVVYAIYSDKFDKIYIGFTSDLEQRMLSHNVDSLNRRSVNVGTVREDLFDHAGLCHQNASVLHKFINRTLFNIFAKQKPAILLSSQKTRIA